MYLKKGSAPTLGDAVFRLRSNSLGIGQFPVDIAFTISDLTMATALNYAIPQNT
ncbi:hypothetical protein COO91_06934 [Nostoc flagelliforme CCNUN1]|uniref:Uncharacterized protein n=1 Tax=Nostoc flagelliforme CCNUN1 TaxID=2038116 RepID=A0A2K8SZM0_9NOSO|nr:hypothetical protein COO91_06934 [Nostoc flagelliforme CCNUN1]